MLAHAVLVERDWLTAGDALLTYDTETGLEWLDVPATSSMSYNDVAAAISSGGSYQNFTFASKQQVTRFFMSAGLQSFFDSTEAPEEIIKIENFLNYWGVCWFIGTGSDPPQRTEFITSNTAGLGPNQHHTGRLIWFAPGTAAYTTEIDVREDNESNFVFGSALVRNATPVTIDGDVNEDGTFNLGDLQIIKNVILNETVNTNVEPAHADFYPAGAPDGIINTSDLILMYQQLL